MKMKFHLSIIIIAIFCFGCGKFENKKISIKYIFDNNLDTCLFPLSQTEDGFSFIENFSMNAVALSHFSYQDWEVYTQENNQRCFRLNLSAEESIVVRIVATESSQNFFSEEGSEILLDYLINDKLLWSQKLSSAFYFVLKQEDFPDFLVYFASQKRLVFRNKKNGTVAKEFFAEDFDFNLDLDSSEILFYDNYLLVSESTAMVDYKKFGDFLPHETEQRKFLLQIK
ncbi:MAG: hypothetical protein JXR63_00140 [Spirochaetales bacterium]|nr:hypothetical protein [Spirochaetales bacterium]